MKNYKYTIYLYETDEKGYIKGNGSLAVADAMNEQEAEALIRRLREAGEKIVEARGDLEAIRIANPDMLIS